MDLSIQNIFTEFAKGLSEIPFNKMLGLRLESIENDFIQISFVMKPELIGNYLQGILHGGVISSVLDMTGGVSAMVSIIQKHPGKSESELKSLIGKTSTINLTVNYLRPGKGEKFFARAKVLHSGNKICFSHIELHNDKGILIASGSGTFLVG